jgi:hypothetical protein
MSELITLLRESAPHQILFFMLVTVILYSIIMRILKKRLRSEKTDSERLFDRARQKDCSEFDIFQLTGAQWNIPEVRIKEDFKRYLSSGTIPYYVRDYLRKN